ncbi:hypothetical protein MNBD_GAMMA20-1601 [hydrothermal vent metagenome]|uniref:Uncharacterized protein n=1 Tax=hydrothermal vent metagenome TaxID=652676 RepID=A0A3B1B1N4_9ZZZZ
MRRYALSHLVEYREARGERYTSMARISLLPVRYGRTPLDEDVNLLVEGGRGLSEVYFPSL